MARMTRGRLPARVYWVRRLMVLGIATLLVVGIAKMLGGSSDASGNDAAQNVADTTPLPSSTGSTSTDPETIRPSSTTKKHHQQADDPVTRVAMPSGPCQASDIAISPSVPKPIAGGDISLVLDISSLETPACTWTLSGDTVALKITSGKDLIWTTSQCPRAIPTQDLVVRQADPPGTLVLHSVTHVPAAWQREIGAAIDWTWCFQLTPEPGGTTRLHLRARGRTGPLLLTAAYLAVIPPADLIMAMGMLHGLRRRCERQNTERSKQ